MKFLFVIPEYPPGHAGGIATFYGSLLPELVRSGYQVSAIVGSPYISGGTSFEDAGVHVQYLEEGRVQKLLPRYSRYAAVPSLRQYLATARAMWEQVDGGQAFDRVEVVDWGLLAAPWIAHSKVPVLIRMHGSSGQISAYDKTLGQDGADQVIRLLEHGLFSSAAALSTYSRLNADYWHSATGRDVPVIPPPLRIPRLEGAVPARRSGFVAGRIQEWKGPHILSEALSILGERAPVVEWAGRSVPTPGSDQEYDTHLSRVYPSVWGSRLKPIGQLVPSDVMRKQREAAFVIVPSLWDVFNLTIAEAMGQRAVVICSTGAGGVDLIRHGENGLVFQSGDAAELARMIEMACVMSADERSRLGNAARETVIETLNPEIIAHNVGKELEALTLANTVPELIKDAVAPIEGPPDDAFLNTMPLRMLIKHSIGRMKSKLLSA